MESNYTPEQVVRLEQFLRDFFAKDPDNPLVAFYSVNSPSPNSNSDKDIYVIAIYPEKELGSRNDTDFYHKKGRGLCFSLPEEFYGKVFPEFCTGRCALESKIEITHYLPHYKCLFGKEAFNKIFGADIIS
ncbi:MAG: hypothetical protein EOM62_09885 [Bacteroidia bacterium]|nr:hypothetical protein [Bacteroidia bacterium]